ncbi:MAG TPA: YihY/virulence factor BrkB family protein [Nakamurella sp.]|nr:YihY/virulence factor BrkB family protein [Nakamurella sp.]
MWEFSEDQCTDSAAALTYYAALAIFPAMLALVSLLGVIGQQSTTEELLGILQDLGSTAVADMLRRPLEQLTSSSASGWGLVIGLGGALWSASGYVGAFGRAMNRIYEIDEVRPFFKLRPVMLVVTMVAVIMAGLVAVGLVLTGPLARAVGDAIGLGETAVTVWNVVKWPALAVIAALVVAILCYATPNVRQPKFRWISPGAGVAIVTGILASALFGFYISQFSNYNKTYGSLARVIIFLLWLWITNLALLFGAELNAEIERGRQLQAGISAEQDIQLPARDTRVIDKTAAKDARDVHEGRALRDSLGASADVSADRPAGHDSTRDDTEASTPRT